MSFLSSLHIHPHPQASPPHLEAKPIYEALLSANKSLGFNGEAAAAEDVVICI